MDPDAPDSNVDTGTQEVSVLVVDAEAPVSDALRKVGGVVLTVGRVERVATVLEALASLEHGSFDLVALHLAPGCAEAAGDVRRLAAVDAKVPIVAYSDREDEKLALTAVRAGAQDCVLREELLTSRAGRLLRHAVERQRIVLELNEARRREQHLASHDPLTGIPNRALFYDRLAQAVAAASRYKNIAAILFVDLDAFKPINDTLGHTAGDRILRVVAGRLRGCIRESDTVARIGGDEFTIVLTRIGRSEDAARVAKHALEAVALPIELDGGEQQVHASIGISIYPDDGEVPDALVRNADAAMYRAKKDGGNRFAFSGTNRPGAEGPSS